MSRFAVSWTHDGQLHAVDLEPVERRPVVMGRDSTADLVVPLPTMSRRQAQLAWDGSRFTIENLSSTNVTRLDGSQVSGPAALADGARIEAGGAVLRFHDLAAGDRVSGPICSHCGRENRSSDSECWFCGTSIVNAVTAVRHKRRVELRLVDEAGGTTDLLDGMALVAPASGGWQAVASGEGAGGTAGGAGTPQVILDEGRPTIAEGADVTVERGGDGPSTGGALATGDRLVAAGRSFVAIARRA